MLIKLYGTLCATWNTNSECNTEYVLGLYIFTLAEKQQPQKCADQWQSHYECPDAPMNFVRRWRHHTCQSENPTIKSITRFALETSRVFGFTPNFVSVLFLARLIIVVEHPNTAALNNYNPSDIAFFILDHPGDLILKRRDTELTHCMQTMIELYNYKIH